MPLFNKSILQTHIDALPHALIEEKYQVLQRHFQDTQRQEQILTLKEEQYQEGFLKDLFVDVLGYTMPPANGSNLHTEFKNVKGSKKADAVIRLTDQVKAVIELKSTSTVNLEYFEDQAFGYKNNHRNCNYVITSNFLKLRFYIDNVNDFIEFNLFTISEQEFKVLYLCLCLENINTDLPLRLKTSSLIKEEEITAGFYEEYAAFRTDLFENIVKLNKQYDKLSLFKKTQKLLDRFLFIMFAEDRQLLATDYIPYIVKERDHFREYGEIKPLYHFCKKHFGYLNVGFKNSQIEIYSYNGGLFQPDEILDSIEIDDVALEPHLKKLDAYDFNSEVDVDILGHIFEHSLNEFESIQRQIEAGETPSVTRRKRDGVFYTPKYITRFIVENSLGKLCEQKKKEMGIAESDYHKERKGRRTDTLVKQQEKLKAYRNWLLHITILDPACGSGAFLNQALNFLIDEHHYIDELDARLLGDRLVFRDIENEILENNIYGVDINEESVEIAKLSLWLRTAKNGRKLVSLNNNIQCGNSLIDSRLVAQDKAFDWSSKYERIMKSGGFDVIIGNPPYLRVQGLHTSFEDETEFYKQRYRTATGRFDIYVLFIEKAFQLLNSSGRASFILPHKFLISDFGEGVREFLSTNKAVHSIISFGSEMVFADASTYTCIIELTKENTALLYKQVKPVELFTGTEFNKIAYQELGKNPWNLQGDEGAQLSKKLNKFPYRASDIFSNISQGIVSVGDDIFYLEGKVNGNFFNGFSKKAGKEVVIEADLMRPILMGDVKQYERPQPSMYAIYPHYEKKGKTIPYEEDEMKEKFPFAYQYFLPYKEELIAKKIRYKTNPRCWYSLHRSREISLFEQPKLITPETSLGTNMTFDESGLFHNTQVYSLIKKAGLKLDYKFLLSLLNSKILWYHLTNSGNVLRGGYFRFKTSPLEIFPIPDYTKVDQKPFIEKVDQLLEIKTQVGKLANDRFLSILKNEFALSTVSTKLESWYTLDWNEFVGELSKRKVQLKGVQKEDWFERFTRLKQDIIDIVSKADVIAKELDKLVYSMYGLSPAEITVVESAYER